MSPSCASGLWRHRVREDSHIVVAELFFPSSEWQGRDWPASAGKNRSRGFEAAPESAAKLPQALAASNTEGVGFCLLRLLKPCSDLSGHC